MEPLYARAVLIERKAGDGGGPATFIFRITNEVVDRDGEIIAADGWVMTNYKKNPVVLDSHNYFGIANIVGKTTALERVEDAWHASIQFNGTPGGQLAQQLVEEDNLRATSVGFMSLKSDRPDDGPRRHTKQELWEISVVPVPSNFEALRLRGAGMQAPPGRQSGAQPPHDAPAWDDEDVDLRDGVEKGWIVKDDEPTEIYAWIDPDNADLGHSRKLGHHFGSGEEYAVVLRGVFACMADLYGVGDGARGIPEADRYDVWRHLVRHYRQCGKEPPEFRTRDQLAAYGPDELRGLFWHGELDEMGLDPTPAMKAGRVLSKANEARLREAVEAIQAATAGVSEVLAQLPEDDGRAVDEDALADLDLSSLTDFAQRGTQT